MINDEVIKNRLFEEFIKPTTKKKNYIGIEIEIPIINLDKKAVDFDVVHSITKQFQNNYGDFKEDGIDYDGNVFSLKNPKTDGDKAKILAPADWEYESGFKTQIKLSFANKLVQINNDITKELIIFFIFILILY